MHRQTASLPQQFAGAVFFFCSLLAALLFVAPALANAQTVAQDQLRATIQQEIMADPRSKTMTQAQINGLVDQLTIQAEKQGITPTQLTYRPTAPTPSSTLTPCDNFSCSLSESFGLDDSFPLIPIALFVTAALFILIYGIMHEMGHPHAKF